jgi:hypothetical protein
LVVSGEGQEDEPYRFIGTEVDGCANNTVSSPLIGGEGFRGIAIVVNISDILGWKGIISSIEGRATGEEGMGL